MTTTTEARTLHDIARALGADLVGDGTIAIQTIAHPSLAEGADTLALAMEPRAERALAGTRAVAAVVAAGRAEALAPLRGGLVVRRPRYAMAQLLELFSRPTVLAPGIHPSAVVDPTATIGHGVSIGALCHVGPGARLGDRTRLFAQATVGADASIGEDCQLHSGVRIGDRCIVGARVILQPGVIIGSDGFGFVTPERGSVESAIATGGRIESTNDRLVRINSIGTVVLEDDVEIGAGSCVDRGTVGVTRVGQGTKIDNLVQVGHNCTIGRNCLICGTAGLSGSVTLGDRVSIGGGAGIVDHATIGDDAVILARAAVAGSVPAREVWGGYPAVPYREAMQQLFGTRRVTRLLRDIDDLRQRIEQLERRDNADATDRR